MKQRIVLLILILAGAMTRLDAQVVFKTEYLGSSSYKDIENKKNGGRGSALIYSGSAQLPFSIERTEDGRLKAWGITYNSSFTSLNNNGALQNLSPHKIFNNRVGAIHIRPVREKWSLMATVGAGIYAAHTNIGKTRSDEVLFDGAMLFVWHLRPNLDLGFGAAFNSSFGYPMGFPAFYLKWTLEGRYFVNVQMMDGMNLSGGRHINDWLSLSLVADVNGSVAMQKIEDKKMMFSHSYITVSFQPEFRIGKNISIPLRAGFSADRPAYYEERTLRAFFKGFKREYDPHFQPSLYLSGGINISF